MPWASPTLRREVQDAPSSRWVSRSMFDPILDPAGADHATPPRPLPRCWSCKSRASWTRSDPAGLCPSRHSCPLRPECRFPNRLHEPVLPRELADRENGKNAIRIAVDASPATGYDLASVQLCIMAVRLKASTVDSP